MTNKQQDTNIVETRYQRARILEHHALAQRGVDRSRNQRVVFNTTLQPHWIGKSSRFWYERDSREGKEYRLVDAKVATNEAAFDHAVFAAALARATGKKVDAANLPISQLEITCSPRQIKFSAFGKRWSFVGKNCKQLAVTDSLERETLSPDGKYTAFVRDNNLWLRTMLDGELEPGQERQLTDDGEEYYTYGAVPVLISPGLDLSPLQVAWSPDSKRLFAVQLDTRQVGTVPVVYHAPKENVRPQVEEYRYALQGDAHVPEYRLLSIDVTSGRICQANYHPVSVPSKPFFTADGHGWWASDSVHAYFIDMDRSGQHVRVVEFNTVTGATRVLFEETSSTWINLGPLNYLSPSAFMPLPQSKELIWYSERSGWAQLYLYDLKSGTLKNAITQGQWVVRELLHYDVDRRELWLQTGGRTSGQDPYYMDVCRVNIDTGELTPVVVSNHDYYVACESNSLFLPETLYGVSPNGEHLATTRSRVDEAPVSVLIDRDGKELMVLEEADVSGLPNDWQWPEPVQLKAADGETDIYGVVFRPSNFSSDKSYPVIDNIFSYPSSITAKKRFDQSDHFMSSAALAELGFIVVHIDGRGTPLRSKEFLDLSDGWKTSASHLPDHIAGLRQLAERYPYMDMSRVGIFGGWTTSIGPLYGLLEYAEFYKVGITCSIPHSELQAAFCVEQFEGPLHTKPSNVQAECLAENLQGKLLMMHGMLDLLCLPAATFRVVDALQKANKDFDLVLLPNQSHGCSGNPYFTRRIWDYFVKHLQGAEPPKEFNIVNKKNI